MHKIDPEACQMCGQCEDVCPANAISVPAGKNYFAISDDCIDCGACDSECGFKAIIVE